MIRPNSSERGLRLFMLMAGDFFIAWGCLALAVYIRRMGYVAIALPDLEEKLRAKVTDALDQAFAAFLIDDVARFNAACWMIRARAA